MHITAKVLAAIAALACFAVAITTSSMQAQTWPQRPVRLLVPFGAGSATDITARLFADRLSQRWGQPVVVENRPGGDSNIAVGAFASARDDHTILYSAPNPITVNPILYDKLPYDPAQDLVPISLGSEIFIVVAAPESLKINSLPELVTLARAQPGKLNWVATPGVVYYMFAGFVRNAGLDMSQVPYRDFTQAVNDLAEGRIQVTVTSLATARPQVETGKVKLLAVTNQQRIPARPEIQTVTEAGHPDLAFGAFGGFFGWRGMPNELREKISADIRAVGSDALIAERLGAVGIRPRTSTPAEFAAAIEEERSKVAAIARAIGSKPQ
jgi:tripartite-type tricarboxylate transporter receptor subunit TctC